MVQRAKYYVDDWSGCWLTEVFTSKRKALAWAIDQSLRNVPIRIRYRSKVIARWRDGKRVK